MKRLFLAVLCIGAVAGCSSGLKHPVREVTATIGLDQVQRVRVTTHSFWFDPNRIVVKRGIPVELTVKNGALLVPHDFSCDAKAAGTRWISQWACFVPRRWSSSLPPRLVSFRSTATWTGTHTRA